jgi:rhodanese-related sulfurtransferase
MREIDLVAFAATQAGGAVVVDVREPTECLAGHVPGARLIPMGQLASRLDELPRTEPVYLICQSGNRSSSMAAFLERAGFDVRSVSGGTAGWAAAGRPLVTGRHASLA